MLLPLQGARLIALIPRVLPWDRCFCPFRTWGAWYLKYRCTDLAEPVEYPISYPRILMFSVNLSISIAGGNLPF